MVTNLKRFLLVLLMFFGLQAHSQSKKWTLQECVEYALQHNISVRQSELDLKLSEISKKEALGNFFPSASANATHSWNIGLNVNPVTNTSQNVTSQYTNAGINTQVDIFRGLQNQATFRRSKMAIIAGQYQLQKIQEDVALNVANAYLQILFNRENLKVQQQQQAIDREQLKRTGELVQAGSVPRGDLVDVEATVALDNQRVIAAENQLLISRLSLAQLLQLNDFETFDIADENFPMAGEILMQSPNTIYDRAKELRTEIKLAQANLEVAEQDVKIARSAYMPSLTGFYSLNTSVSYNDNISVSFDENGLPVQTSTAADPFWTQIWNNKGHSFGVQLSVPIFNGFAVRNNVARSRVALDRSKLALDQQGTDLKRNVYTAYTDAQGALRAYEAAVAAAKARTQALDYARERYGVGLINVFDLNQAQTLSVNAESEVLRTKYDYIFRIKILEFYFGVPIYQKQ